MKKFLLLFLLLFLTACSAQPTPAVVAMPVPPTSEFTPVPEVALVPSETPVPAAINAPVVEAPSIVTIDMLDEVYGWALTNAQVIRTNDGGLTWYNVTPPGLSDVSLARSTYLDANHAWIQMPDPNNLPNSGTLYRTKDGGMTWTLNSIQFNGAQMTFLDENSGWVMADLGVAAGSNAVAIYQTPDGGSSWFLVFTHDPNQPNTSETLPLGGLKSMLVPLNMQTAWVGGVTYSPATVYLYGTDDAGHTWSQVDLAVPPGAESSEISVDAIKFVNQNDGFIALRFAGANYQTGFYVTHDAGATWTLMPTILPGSGTTEILSAQEIVFYNGQQFYATRDAAQTWTVADPNVVFGDFFAYMSFANASTGWVIMSDLSNHRSLLKTTDGGSTWFPILP